MDHAWETRDFTHGSHCCTVAEAVALARARQTRRQAAGRRRLHRQSGRRRLWRRHRVPEGPRRRPASSRSHFTRSATPRRCRRGCAPGSAPDARLTLGGKTDPAMGGGPLTLDGEVVCLTNGKFIAYGPMGGGVERNYGPSMVFRRRRHRHHRHHQQRPGDRSRPVHLARHRPDPLHDGRGQIDAAFPRRLRADRPRNRAGRHRRAVRGNLHRPSCSPRSAARSGRSTRSPTRAPDKTDRRELGPRRRGSPNDRPARSRSICRAEGSNHGRSKGFGRRRRWASGAGRPASAGRATCLMGDHPQRLAGCIWGFRAAASGVARRRRRPRPR